MKDTEGEFKIYFTKKLEFAYKFQVCEENNKNVQKKSKLKTSYEKFLKYEENFRNFGRILENFSTM